MIDYLYSIIYNNQGEEGLKPFSFNFFMLKLTWVFFSPLSLSSALAGYDFCLRWYLSFRIRLSTFLSSRKIRSILLLGVCCLVREAIFSLDSVKLLLLILLKRSFCLRVFSFRYFFDKFFNAW